MSETARTLMTLEEFLAIPEGDTLQHELIDGVVHTSPRPRARHAHVIVAATRRIAGPYHLDEGGPGGWWILPETLVAFGPHNVVAPDLAGWRRERMPALPDSVAIEVIPDWVCEVLSPTTARRDRVAKSRLYARAGVPWMWMIDPALRTLEAYGNRDGQWMLLGSWTDDDTVVLPPFDEIPLWVGALFPPRPPDAVAEGEASWGP